MLAELPWPAGSVAAAVDALRAGDVIACGRLVDAAFGIDIDERALLLGWWMPIYERVTARGAY